MCHILLERKVWTGFRAAQTLVVMQGIAIPYIVGKNSYRHTNSEQKIDKLGDCD